MTAWGPVTLRPRLNSEARILIVDDDLEIRQLLARYLSAQGFQVTTAENASKMNQALARQAYDLVVLDVLLQVLRVWTSVVRCAPNPERRSSC